MIIGTVNDRCEASVALEVRGPNGGARSLEAIVDTGFSGTLTLPRSIVAELDLRWRTRGSAVLANGSIDDFDIHVAEIVWAGNPRKALVEVAEMDPLAGVRLLYAHSLRIEMIEGGRVELEALPS